ncbi:hypothetical protein FQA39_LY13604 [Lamprigera yunnana]|nr:hypothetical protein FQA39_LY13604 [Lamprigera yunnana]
MHSSGKKLVNLALLEGNKQVDNNPTPTGTSEVQMNDDFIDFGSDDSVADKDYVPSATSSSESELDVEENISISLPTPPSQCEAIKYGALESFTLIDYEYGVPSMGIVKELLKKTSVQYCMRFSLTNYSDLCTRNLIPIIEELRELLVDFVKIVEDATDVFENKCEIILS